MSEYKAVLTARAFMLDETTQYWVDKCESETGMVINFIATDISGELRGFTEKPIFEKCGYWATDRYHLGRNAYIHGGNWVSMEVASKSLKRIKGSESVFY